MLGRVKGCINKSCVANQKKLTYKEVDEYCSKCGKKLYYVCKKCYMKLPDDSAKYCLRCLAEKQDSKNINLKKVGVVAAKGIGILGVGVSFIRVIKKSK